MFGSDNFPLGPNGQFPKQRIGSSGDGMPMSQDMEEVYELSGLAKLPVRERDFNSTLQKVGGRMKFGRAMREGQDEQKFKPRSMKDRRMMRTSKLERQGGY